MRGRLFIYFVHVLRIVTSNPIPFPRIEAVGISAVLKLAVKALRHLPVEECGNPITESIAVTGLSLSCL